MEKIKKIDIHAHSTPYAEIIPVHPVGWRMRSPEELIELYDSLNIEKGFLLPISAPECQPILMTSESCKVISDKYPDRYAWFCNVDPRMLDNNDKSDLSHILNHYKKLGAIGVGEVTCQLYADDPMMDNFFYHCGECDLPVTIHIGPQVGSCYGIVDEPGLYRIEKMLKKHPKLKLVGHSQPFWNEISTDVPENRNTNQTGKVKEGRIAELMRKYPNLYCDLSARSGANAMMRDTEYAAKFMTEFSDRIMYGCDICGQSPDFPYEFDKFLDMMVEKNHISETVYRKIVRENAIRIYNL